MNTENYKLWIIISRLCWNIEMSVIVDSDLLAKRVFSRHRFMFDRGLDMWFLSCHIFVPPPWRPCHSLLKHDRVSFHLDQIQCENKHSTSGDTSTSTPIAISQLRWNVQFPRGSLLHQLHGFGPSLDHLVRSKCQRSTALNGRVEFGSINEGAGVMTFTRRVDGGCFSIGCIVVENRMWYWEIMTATRRISRRSH